MSWRAVLVPTNFLTGLFVGDEVSERFQLFDFLYFLSCKALLVLCKTPRILSMFHSVLSRTLIAFRRIIRFLQFTAS